MPRPTLERMVWDEVPVADTRPAMKAGIPFYALFVIFFGPGILVVLTFNVFWMTLIPVLWTVVKWAYLGNPNRPFEWLLWIVSGAAFADWREWGGVSDDPHGRRDPWGSL